VDSFKDFADEENVRKYLVNPEGKQKARRSAVHYKIKDTLENHGDRFSLLNGGFCLVAKGAEVDDKSKSIELRDCSIINGSQTQGEIKEYLRVQGETNPDDLPSVFYQILVINDEDIEEYLRIVAEISIARNFQNSVKLLSIAGRMGRIDPLERALEEQAGEFGLEIPKFKKSESDFGSGFFDSEKLIQVIWAIMPPELDRPNKTYAYNQKAICLKRYIEVREIWEKPEDEREPGEEKELEKYNFFLENAGLAWSLYLKWKAHSSYPKLRLHSGKGYEKKAFRRLQDGSREAADGLVFPILAAHSEFFVKNDEQKWEFKIPESFEKEEQRFLEEDFKETYINTAGSNPNTMGKSISCYQPLARSARFYKRIDGLD